MVNTQANITTKQKKRRSCDASKVLLCETKHVHIDAKQMKIK